MHHDIQILIFEDDNPTRRVFVTVCKWSEPKKKKEKRKKMLIDVRHKHRAVIEFLFFEGCPSDEMAIYL
jgi:hypothetical protein